MRKNITLPAVLLIGLLMTCLTATGQSKVTIHDAGELRFEAQDARLKAEAQEARFKAEAERVQFKAEAQEARFKAEAQKARSKAEAQEAQQKEKARGKGAPEAFMKLSSANTAGMQLRSDGTTTYAFTVTYSMTGDKQNKTVYTYTKGRLTLYERSYWNGDDWVNSYKSEYAYDDYGYQVLDANYSGADNTWLKQYKYVYAYNDKGTKILDEYYYGKDNEWVPSRKYAYDNWGNILNEYYTEEGAPFTKDVYARDDYGHYTLRESYTGVGNEWMPGKKEVYKYDSHGSQTLSESYTGVGKEWMPDEKAERIYDYDANGNPRTLLNASYKGEGSEWAPVEKYVYEYDANGQTLYERYTGVNNEWIKLSKSVSKYDANGDRTLYEGYTGIDNEWVGQSKTTSNFNNRIPIAGTRYSWKDNGWVISWEETYDNGEKAVDRNKVYATIITHNNYDSEGATIISTSKGAGINIPSYGIFFYSFYDGNSEYEFTSDNDGNLTSINAYYLIGTDKTLAYNYVIGYENKLPISFEHNVGNVPSTKLVRQYDVNGNIILDEWHRWDYNKNLLVTDYKQVSAYDAKGRQTLYEYYQGNESGDGWISTNEKYVYAYNDAGTEILYERYNNSNGSGDNWIYDYKRVNAYNDAGRRILYETYNGNENGDGWAYHQKAIDDYDEAGRRILYVYYSGNESKDAWIPGSKEESAFDSSGNEILYVQYTWDINADEWIKSYKRENAYDAAGRQTLYASYTWDAGEAEWAINSKRVNAYDANGRRLLYEDLYLSNSGLGGYKEEYEYDAYGTASYIDSYWDTANEAWRGNSRTTYYEKGKNGSTIVANHYWWEDDQWIISGYTLYYPDAEQVAPIELKDTQIDVTESYMINYTFNLESLLPSISDAVLGEVTYSIGTVTNDYYILGTINYTEGTSLTLPIYGADAGTAAIPVTIESANLGRFLAIIRVTTSGTPYVSVNGVSLNSSEIGLAVNGTFQLVATVSPAGADNPGVTWSTSNAAIATVANGVVTAIAPGTATITVSTDDGGYTATCTVTVTSGTVGAEAVSQEIVVFFNESVLTIDSPASETIAVYDFNGRLLFTGKKPQGKTVFTVGNAGGKIVIVKGSSGWTKKIVR
ncbi:MAG: Ig-like domain-containing protein [Tannerellaceae bacterium]|jgi:hypothetical protein|nr:Ig-like domain-containing protein [Tannerellaceae bacterium]